LELAELFLNGVRKLTQMLLYYNLFQRLNLLNYCKESFGMQRRPVRLTRDDSCYRTDPEGDSEDVDGVLKISLQFFILRGSSQNEPLKRRLIEETIPQ